MSAQPSPLGPFAMDINPDSKRTTGIDRSDLTYDYLEALREKRSPKTIRRMIITVLLQLVAVRVIVHLIFFPFTVGEWIVEGAMILVGVFFLAIMFMTGKSAMDRQIEEVFDLETEMAKRDEEEERRRHR